MYISIVAKTTEVKILFPCQPLGARRLSASISIRVASPPQWIVLIDLTIFTQHAFILNPIVLTIIAPVMSIHWCRKTIRTSHPSGSRRNTSFVFLPLVPEYPSQSSVPNRVQKVFTESVAQLALSRPE